MAPGASSPSRRFETLRILSQAGVPTGVSLAPLIPGLNESDIPEVLERAREAGADMAFMTLVRLSKEVLPVFRERIAEAFPERVSKIENGIRELRGGDWNDSRFASRMHGRGARWEALARMFDLQCRRLGYRSRMSQTRTPIGPPAQGRLFESGPLE